MSKDPSLTDRQPMRVKHSWSWLIYLASALALVGLIGWATLNEMTRSPARDATTELSPYGLVTIRFSTDPTPALPTGTVMLSFMPMNPRQRPVELDKISFEYGRENNNQPVGAGEAQLMSDGSGMFMGNAQFPDVGNWWVRVTINKGDAHAEVRFIVYVEPAQ